VEKLVITETGISEQTTQASTMNDSQKQANIAKYTSLQGKDNPSGRAGYDNIARQYRRFAEIKSFMGDLGGSVLDVGCGNAEFLFFLQATGFAGSYTGIDVSPQLLGEGKLRFPDASFLEGDFLKFEKPECDYVVACGIFNYDYGQDLDLIKAIILRMHKLSRRKAIFNGVRLQNTRKDPGTFYIDQWELCAWLEGQTNCKLEVRSNFVECNFTVSISRTLS
jgi:SAM-dependent methyltransferase